MQIATESKAKHSHICAKKISIPKSNRPRLCEKKVAFDSSSYRGMQHKLRSKMFTVNNDLQIKIFKVVKRSKRSERLNYELLYDTEKHTKYKF